MKKFVKENIKYVAYVVVILCILFILYYFVKNKDAESSKDNTLYAIVQQQNARLNNIEGVLDIQRNTLGSALNIEKQNLCKISPDKVQAKVEHPADHAISHLSVNPRAVIEEMFNEMGISEPHEEQIVELGESEIKKILESSKRINI